MQILRMVGSNIKAPQPPRVEMIKGASLILFLAAKLPEILKKH
jgi:hypothetical protein